MSAENPKTITICMGSSCFSRGNNRNLQLIQDYLSKNHLDADVELAGSRCEGQCVSGPNIRINGHLYGGVDEKMLINLLDEHFKVK